MQSNNEIYYTTVDNRPLHLSASAISPEAQVIAHLHADNYWILQFDRPIRSIADGAFFNATRLSTITLPCGVTSVGEGAFFGCSSLCAIDLPRGLCTIGEAAFCGCSRLEVVSLPSSISAVGRNAFDGCSALRRFEGRDVSTDGRCLIIEGHLVAFAPALLRSYRVPSAVRSLDRECFAAANALECLTFAAPLHTIVGGALAMGERFCRFDGAGATNDGRSLVIDDRVVGFAPAGLTHYSLPAGISSIAPFCFEGCSELEELTLPSSISSIDDWAFDGCSSLRHLICHAAVPPLLGMGVLSHCHTLRQISLPPESVDAYRSAEGWGEQVEKFVAYLSD